MASVCFGILIGWYMDPHYWHLQSMIIDHDHPYNRPSYLDPISTLCIEPAFKSDGSDLSKAGAGHIWIDVEGDEAKFPSQATEPSINENICQFTRFCTSGPIEELKYDNNQPSYASSSRVTWNTTVDKLHRKMRKVLVQTDLEGSISSQMSRHKFGEFRRYSCQELLTKNVARHIRKIFTSLNWRIDTCAELHESLLNTLPSDLLQPYLSGYACLMHRSRTSPLLRRLNAEIISQRTMKRFDYSKYLDCAVLPSTDGFGSFLSRATYGRLHDGSASSYSPITCIPTDCLITGSLGSSTSTPGRASSIMDEPVFMCVITKVYTKGYRISKMLKNLSQLGRLMIVPMSGTNNIQIRRLIRHFVSLTEDPRPIPIYIIGFGEHCGIVLTAAITSPYLLPSSNGGALEEIICGRLTSSDAPIPVKPWLAGLVLIAPPKSIYHLGDLCGGLDNIARRCSLLLVISSKHQAEANAFRETLIAARRRSTTASAHGSVSGFRGMDWKVPCEFDLRMLVIGGVDHLLRMHPATLRRFATTQSAIDLAVITAIKNLVAVCRALVNTSATPVSTHGTSASELMGSRNATGLPVSWFSNTTNIQQENRRVADSTAFTRKASILRGGVQARSFAERHPLPQPYTSRQNPSFHPRDRLTYSAGCDAGPLIRYGDGARSRTLCGRQTQQNPTPSVFLETRTPRYDSSEDMMDSQRLGPVPHPANVRNRDTQSGPHGGGRARKTRFYDRN
ncbi:hypothetical protein EGR_03443 [Echinococcus granulosus]|uniref:KAT8 regulatory NSL complex subunit 3 n=1 Tax=Echinococcus granulosus TaxID=6210 RepID=W6V5M5_ECHGR|nr:hypothetical protein EGR_03443 [Echinococcus granulosus]EUB61629.1 hypothetical protein EGR_03443 [Echinococcus granulosus]